VFVVLAPVPGCYQITGIGDGLGNGEDNPGLGQTTGAGDSEGTGIDLDDTRGPGDADGTGAPDGDTGGAATDTAGETGPTGEPTGAPDTESTGDSAGNSTGDDTTGDGDDGDTGGDSDNARCGNPPGTTWTIECGGRNTVVCKALPDYGYTTLGQYSFLIGNPLFRPEQVDCDGDLPTSLMCEFGPGVSRERLEDYFFSGTGVCMLRSGGPDEEAEVCFLAPKEIDLGAPVLCQHAPWPRPIVEWPTLVGLDGAAPADDCRDTAATGE
jgi:hypothetical protein